MRTDFQPGNIFEMAEHADGETAVLVLSGELDLGTVGQVQERLDQLRAGKRAVVLDLDRLTFMDSTGIRLLLRASEDAARDEWPFHVTRGSEPVRRVLAAARVAERLPYADAGQA
jgi:stage II sporulation protein AA (anti-sigma F factor antagonist)